MSRLRLAFMGTSDFAVRALAALIAAGHEIDAVYTRPPRPAGRGQALQRSVVHLFAAQQGLPVRTPATLRDPREQAFLAALGLDAAVVAAYGLILSKPILQAPRLGCLNIHASLLPRWRGAAPVQRAILAGDRESGVTIMQMDEGLDTGAMLLQKKIPIAPDMNAGGLHDALAALGARLIVEALEDLEAGRLEAIPQPTEGITYAAKIDKTETRLDWREPAEHLARMVRAFAPVPGAWFELAGERIRVLAAEVVPRKSDAAPGTTLDDRLSVACGKGALRFTWVQRAGGRPMETRDFLRGRPMPSGTVLG